jgi:hypothetical protein
MDCGQNLICVRDGTPVEATIKRLVDGAAGAARINVSHSPTSLRINEIDGQEIQ